MGLIFISHLLFSNANVVLLQDQATVLVQIGLLDPKLIPDAFKDKMKRLPVMGREAARKVVDEDSEPSNELIEDW
jgi:hypothetical protein